MYQQPSKKLYKISDNSFAHIFIDFIQIKRKTLFIKGWCIPENDWELVNISCTNSTNIQEKSLYQERVDVYNNLPEYNNKYSGFNLIIRNIQLFTAPEIILYFQNINNNKETYTLRITAKKLFTAKLYWQNILFVLNNGFGKKSKLVSTKKYNTLDSLINSSQTNNSENNIYKAEVILPIYNGYEYLESLLDKLTRDLQVSRLIIIEDCSTDSRVRELLNKYSSEHSDKILLIENLENLGFVQSVNKAMGYITDDFVILNSDVDVPDNWLTRLIQPIKLNKNIASTTPFTNAGTILSFPNICEDNNIYNNLDVSIIDSYFQSIKPENNNYIELPTGVGFCMGVSHQALKKIGKFNEKLFGKGYGEENDWCQRAIKHKYKNIAVTNLYVYHAHGGSFPSVERELYIKQGLQVLNSLYPKYHQQVQKFIQEDNLKIYRDYVQAELLLRNKNNRNIELIIDHNIGGGANSYRNELIEELKSQDKIILLLTYDEKKVLYNLAFHCTSNSQSINLYFNKLESIKIYLEKYTINKLWLNNLVSFPDIQEIIEFIINLEKLASEFFLHDYFSLCQSHTLLDSQGKYCDLPENLSVCQRCILRQPSPQNIYKKFNLSIIEWRELFYKLLNNIQSIRAYSEVSAELLKRVYPELSSKIAVKAHAQYYKNTELVNLPVYRKNSKPRVAFVGSIGHSKGAEVIQKLAQANLIEIIIIGKISPMYKLPDYVTVHGVYKPEELPELLERYQVHAGFISSVWPETYNFVTDELMSLNIPVFSFDIGAHAERLKNYSQGYILSRELIYEPVLLSQEITHFVGLNETD